MDAFAELSARCQALIAAAGGASAAALESATLGLQHALAALPLPAEMPLSPALKGQVVAALNAAEQARIAVAYNADRNRRGLERLTALSGANRRTGFA